MVKKLLLSFLVALGFSASFGQNNTGFITGHIRAVDGQPLELVSVSLIEPGKNTLTDTKGSWMFAGLLPGKYTVRIQMLGLKEKDIPVDVRAGDTATIDFTLTKENIQALQEVTVSGNINRFTKRESIYIARLPLKNLENPQVYTTITKELFKEQMAVDLGSISKKAPRQPCLVQIFPAAMEGFITASQKNPIMASAVKYLILAEAGIITGLPSMSIPLSTPTEQLCFV